MTSLPIKNPYSHLLNMMRDAGSMDNPISIQIGTVIAPPPNIVVDFGNNLQIDKDNIYIADYLLLGYSRSVTVNTGTPTDGTIMTKDTLQVGDTVAAMATEDKQKYIILCKVVFMGG